MTHNARGLTKGGPSRSTGGGRVTGRALALRRSPVSKVAMALIWGSLQSSSDPDEMAQARGGQLPPMWLWQVGINP
jgi:hypothetical protein